MVLSTQYINAMFHVECENHINIYVVLCWCQSREVSYKYIWSSVIKTHEIMYYFTCPTMVYLGDIFFSFFLYHFVFTNYNDVCVVHWDIYICNRPIKYGRPIEQSVRFAIITHKISKTPIGDTQSARSCDLLLSANTVVVRWCSSAIGVLAATTAAASLGDYWLKLECIRCYCAVNLAALARPHFDRRC